LRFWIVSRSTQGLVGFILEGNCFCFIFLIMLDPPSNGFKVYHLIDSIHGEVTLSLNLVTSNLKQFLPSLSDRSVDFIESGLR
jgi:hypothetical protein